MRLKIGLLLRGLLVVGSFLGLVVLWSSLSPRPDEPSPLSRMRVSDRPPPPAAATCNLFCSRAWREQGRWVARGLRRWRGGGSPRARPPPLRPRCGGLGGRPRAGTAGGAEEGRAGTAAAAAGTRGWSRLRPVARAGLTEARGPRPPPPPGADQAPAIRPPPPPGVSGAPGCSALGAPTVRRDGSARPRPGPGRAPPPRLRRRDRRGRPRPRPGPPSPHPRNPQSRSPCRGRPSGPEHPFPRPPQAPDERCCKLT